MRAQAGLTSKERGAPMDVLWFRLSRRPVDPNEIVGRFGPGSIIVLINRGEYWQCGYVIAKGSLDALRARGLDKFRAALGRLEPLLSDRTDELDDWDAIKLLTVRVDRLRRWYRPGLLCIGDAAHAMSPVGGVGINLAIQDAVATANILAEPLRAQRVTIEHLRMVQERRSLPTFVIQSLQLAVQRGVIARALDDSPTIHPRAPLGLRLIGRAPLLQRLNARLIGMGVRAEHVASSRADGSAAATCAHRRASTVDEQGNASTIATGSLTQTRTLDLFTRTWGVTATILSVLYTAVLVVFAAAVAPLRGGHWVTPIMRFWCWLIFHTCGITGEVEGLEHIDGLDTFVLVSNHQSLFDILAILYLIPRETRFIAKREIMQVPLIGFAMARSGNIVIDRKTGGHAIRHALAQISQGYSICVFAEGRRHSDNQVHEFSDGAAWLAIATRQACVPMAISGTLAVMPRGALFVKPGRHIKLVIGQPLSTQDLRGKDRTELTHRLESAVRELFRPSDPAESP
jgi:1-acyl-sn-glycerol-3-phosphate acyltransferase